jgi:hypothetical protein
VMVPSASSWSCKVSGRPDCWSWSDVYWSSVTQQSISEFAIVKVFAKLPKSSTLAAILEWEGGYTLSNAFDDVSEILTELFFFTSFVVGHLERFDNVEGVGCDVLTITISGECISISGVCRWVTRVRRRTMI